MRTPLIFYSDELEQLQVMATNQQKNSKHSISTSSRFSLKSAKSAVEQIPKTRACPWVAQWFTIPQAVLKPVQMALGLTIVVLMLIWESGDITIAHLNTGTINYRNELHGFVGISLLTVLYSIGMATLGVSGLNLPPFLQVLFAGVMLTMWVFGAPTMSASIAQLDNSRFARRQELDTLYLQIATSLGFAILMAFVLDILLAFMLLRRADDNPKQLSRELHLSKSSLMATRSGKSIAAPKSTSARVASTGSSSKDSEPVNERSPLKPNEEVPGNDDDDDDNLSYQSL